MDDSYSEDSLIENFTLFSEEGSGLVKLVGKNHQYLGVNNAFDALKTIRKREEGREGEHGKLGVFWHTQGSGKSYSMVFFSQKVSAERSFLWVGFTILSWNIRCSILTTGFLCLVRS